MRDVLNAATHAKPGPTAHRQATRRAALRRLGVRLLAFRLFGRYSLLSLPISYKLVVANSLLVGFGFLAGIWFAQMGPWDAFGSFRLVLMAGGVLAGVALSVGATYLIVKTALAPLARLQQTVEAVRAGDSDARARDSVLSDPSVELFRRTFNDMLEEMARDRQRLRTLSSGLLAAQEEERKRVARELHDEVGQLTTAVLTALQRARRACASTTVEPLVEQAISLASLACDSVRRVAYEMRPKILDDLGLVPALEAYLHECCGKHREIQVSFAAVNLDERLPQEVELVLYRVVREAMSNAGRHAEPSRVAVVLERSGGVVEARVEDDGRGFDVGAVLRTPRLAVGLMSMQERLAMVGGSLMIDSMAGSGTRVRLEIPLS